VVPRFLSRRQLLKAGSATVALAGVSGIRASTDAAPPEHTHDAHTSVDAETSDHHHAGLSMTVGDVDTAAMGFDPSAFLTTFDYGQTSQLPNGQTLREFQLVAIEKEIEIAPGVFFSAWTYNGQVPGPTLRCNEGDRLQIHFTNASSHPHTIHFHGIHSAAMDGVSGIGRGDILPGESFTYEFDAFPFGCHLYHCHTAPLKRHVHKGLYGAFIINPDPERHGELAKKRHPAFAESRKWQEFIGVMNAFDTTFDGENEVYALNTVAFHYMKYPIRIERSRPVRFYVVNITEFDPINSFHLHANFFDYFDHGTTLEPTSTMVDTIMQCQAQRGILEFSFSNHETGQYMFHAHQSEFAELGWMSVFDVVE